MNSRMLLLFLFPAWVFPECYCISGNLFYKTTFPIVPVAVLVSHDASHMRNVLTLVLAEVYKMYPPNHKLIPVLLSK